MASPWLAEVALQICHEPPIMSNHKIFKIDNFCLYPMFDNLQLLHRFITIAEHGTLHAAAHQLALTQPALSRCLRLLEEQSGAPLFERHPRGLRLTTFGERAYRHARHLLRESQLASDDLRSVVSGHAGSLRMAAAPVWMSSILPQVISAMHSEFPALKVSLNSLNFGKALEGLDNGSLDIFCGGFQIESALPSFVASQPLFTTRLNVVASADHPLCNHGLGKLEQLLDYPWVSYLTDRAFLDTVMRKVEAATGKRREASVICDSMLATMNLLNDGPYLSFLPISFITTMTGFNLQVINTPLAEVGFESGIIYRKSLENSTLLSRFQQQVASRIDECGFDAL